MKVIVQPSALRALEAHGEKAYPNEGIGFLFGRENEDGIIVEFVCAVENRRETEAQVNRYEVSPQDFVQAEI